MRISRATIEADMAACDSERGQLKSHEADMAKERTSIRELWDDGYLTKLKDARNAAAANGSELPIDNDFVDAMNRRRKKHGQIDQLQIERLSAITELLNRPSAKASSTVGETELELLAST